MVFYIHGSKRKLSYRLLGTLPRTTSSQFWILTPIFCFVGTLLLLYNLSDGRVLGFFGGYGEYGNGEGIFMDLSKNYFQTSNQLSKSKFLVDNVKCRIPDVGLWDDRVRSLHRQLSPVKCGVANLTYVQDQYVLFNEVTLKGMGYRNLSEINCCYHTIHRPNQSEHNFDKEADNNFRYSKACYSMGMKTKPDTGFIRVTCLSNSLFWNKTIYTNFHVIAQFPNDDHSKGAEEQSISRKIAYWQSCAQSVTSSPATTTNLSDTGTGSNRTNTQRRHNNRPPNVLLLGMDSTSRLNFLRYLPRTQAVLTQIGAVPMKGYTKVGENTFPNFVPLLTSFSERELTKICYPSRWIPQDKCPYIWKQFSSRNYLTAHLEDSPNMAIFNYMKTGFIRPPVDIYLRPWALAAYRGEEKHVRWTLDCIGYQRPENIILDYVVDLTTLSESQNLPYFITTWLTDLTHEDMSTVQRLDDLLASTLVKLHGKGLLDNTLLLVMSDHGYRFAEVRATTSGWYEDKLPAMFIKLPEKISKVLPVWKHGLEHNSKHLTTPFDVHASLMDVLRLADFMIGGKSAVKRQYSTSTPSSAAAVTKTSLEHGSLRGLSLFKKLPLRSCKEAGVPPEYCACSSPVTYTSNWTRIQLGAKAVIQNINARLPPVCSPLSIHSITASAVFNKATLDGNDTPDISSKSIMTSPNTTNFIISLTTSPGRFRYEALLTFDNNVNAFTQVNNILRTTKKDTGTDCLNAQQEAEFELFCHCKWWH